MQAIRPSLVTSGSNLLSLLKTASESLPGFEDSFQAGARSAREQGLSATAAAGKVAAEISHQALTRLETDLLNHPPGNLLNEELKDKLHHAFEEGQGDRFAIYRQTVGEDLSQRLHDRPDPALQAYSDKLAQYGLLDQIYTNANDLQWNLAHGS